MPKEFTDITIAGVNADATVPLNNGSGSWRVQLNLSAPAPLRWRQLVSQLYKEESNLLAPQPIYVDSDGITILGVDIESTSEMDEYKATLTKVVAMANEQYRLALQLQDPNSDASRARREASRKLAERWKD